MADLASPPLLRPTALQIVTFGAIYLACSGVGYFLAFPSGAYWPFWPANGLLLGALLVCERRSWMPLCAATLAPALLADVVFEGFHAELVPLALGTWLANMLEPLLAAWLIRRLSGERLSLSNGGEYLALLVLGGMLAPAVGATLGAAAHVAFEGKRSFQESWLQWWIGDAIGMIVVAPVVITWCANETSLRFRRRGWAYAAEFTVCCVLLVGMAERAFHQPPGNTVPAAQYPFFVMMPLFLWAGLRFEPRAVSLTILFVACLAIWRTTRGFGALAEFGETAMQQGLLLQGFVAEISCVTMLFAASIEGRERAEARLHVESAALARTESEERRQKDLLQSVLDSMGEAVVVVDRQESFVLFNPAARTMHQRGPEPISVEEWPRVYRIFLPDGMTAYPADQLPSMRALRGEACDDISLVIRPTDSGEPIFARASARPIRSENGEISGAVVVHSDITPSVRAEREQTRLIAELQQALGEIRTLRGLVPICAKCQKVRNDAGAWEKFEAYATAQTGVEFMPGFCPDCTAPGR